MIQITREQLLRDLENLKEIVQLPGLYLATYFSDLRNQVDKDIVSNQIRLQNDDDKLPRLNELWCEMIHEIDAFEKQCTQVRHNLNENKVRIDKLETALNESHATYSLEQVQETIKKEEFDLLQKLFQNRTVVFVDAKDFLLKFERRLIDGILVTLNDQFISHKSIKNRLTNLSNEKCLSNQTIKIIQLEKKLTRDYILEVNLNLNSLLSLDLPYNKIIELNNFDTFNGLNNLQALDLHGNQLTEIKADAFKCLVKLKKLDLSYNLINGLERGAFNSLSNLRTLYLGSNQLSELNAGLLNGLAKLQTLSLGYNQIIEINENTFSGLFSLEKLDLNTNQINELQANVFKRTGLACLRSLALHNNKLNPLARTLLEDFFEKEFIGKMELIF